MQVHENKGVIYLGFQALEETGLVTHGFTTRWGGVSRGIYSSMNLSFTRGDDPEAVRENYHRIADAMGFSYDSIVCTDQTHTTNIRVAAAEDRGKGITKEKDYRDIDGLITNVPGLVLATFYADCVPLYFLDPRRKAIGLSHSGWRGTVNKMGKATAEAMTREYGTDPKDIIAAVGPSICQDCYEVSQDVADAFKSAFSRETHSDIIQDKKNGKYQLNLWKANELVLREAGIPEENISLPNLCTCCNPRQLFSHRASKGKRGNLAAFLQLRDNSQF
ncbi:peptidoglycan editing factor PgeF [Lactonifactor longoviformis]|nr:peptidoglycan editing factor PgeF [Lactonifactor longoviformis]